MATPCSGTKLSQKDPITTYDSAADYLPATDNSEPDGKKLKRINLEYVFSGWTNGDMAIRNNTNGANINLTAKNSSGVLKELATFSPDGENVKFLSFGGELGGLSVSTDSLNVKGKANFLANTTGGSITVGGIINGVSGQEICIVNGSTVNTTTIEHLKVTGNQQIVCPTNSNYVLSNFESIHLFYNAGNQLWYTKATGK